MTVPLINDGELGAAVYLEPQAVALSEHQVLQVLIPQETAFRATANANNILSEFKATLQELVQGMILVRQHENGTNKRICKQ